MRPPPARAELRRRRSNDFWRSMNRFLLVLIILASVAMVALAFFPEMRRINEMKANLADLQEQLAAEDLKLRQQQREERLLNEDPAYVELLARDRLGVMKEGETIIRLDEPDPASSATPGSTPALTAPRP